MLRDVLRYWLGVVRHEEAIGLKVRAAPPVRKGRWSPNLLQPGRGRTYFKLPCGGDEEGERFLLREEPTFELDLADDRGEFFEHWLRGSYRAQRFRRGDDGGLTSMVAGFPVLFDPRKGLLMTLLRLPLSELLWLDEMGEPWRLPSFKRRRQGVNLKPPATVRLEGDDEAELPYALDEVVLSRILGVQEEAVGDFVRRQEGRSRVDPEEMIRSVIDLLIGTSDDSDTPPKDSELLPALTHAMAGKVIEPRVRVWPLGIVYDGASNMTTHYLQQDLRSLIRRADSVDKGSAFYSYMTGSRLPVAERAHLGCRGERELTASQRLSAQRFLGSRLTTVQGPPGTGKTELILSLCAQTLIERMARGGNEDLPRGTTSPLLVVASTNNRAVDNVTEPICDDLSDERLPIALRVGSRMVVTSATVTGLRRTVSWLEHAQSSKAKYLESRDQLRGAVEDLRKVELPLLEARRTAEELGIAEARRAELQLQLEEALRAPPIEKISLKALKMARRALKAARRTFHEEQERFLSAGGTGSGKRRERRKAKKGKLALGALRRFVEKGLAHRLADIDLPFELPEPPEDQEAPPEIWNEAFEDMADLLDQVEDDLEDCAERSRRAQVPKTIRSRLTKVEKDIARLRGESQDLSLLTDSMQEVVAQHEVGLFEMAMTAREAWAALNRDRLLTSMRVVLEALEGAPTLRSFSRTHHEAFNDLLQLFPVFGCTLLSLGNIFPNEPGVISRVVIDEAGQCHPAYAVSAIARADRVLVIGDVNQLEPVIELSEHEERRVLRKLSLQDELEALEPYRVHRDAHASAQALATRAVSDVPTLRDHFRCQQKIIEISNRLCGYDLLVRTHRASFFNRCHLLRGPVLGMNTQGSQVPFIGSWRNDAEIRKAVDFVLELCRSGIDPSRIAVLTPYRGQLYALESALKSAGVRLDSYDHPSPEPLDLFDDPPPRGVIVGTLHRFQGGERDVVVLSMVVSKHRSLPFTNSRVNLINVAVSRARLHLVVIGSSSVLSEGPITRELVRAIPSNCWI